jgi:hypothetical protein
MTRNYTGGLKKHELEDGAYYEGICRNATEARWNAEHQEFVHWRTKFNMRFLESIRHFEDETRYDVFTAVQKKDVPEFPFEWIEFYNDFRQVQ